jgi:hypothetical protein
MYALAEARKGRGEAKGGEEEEVPMLYRSMHGGVCTAVCSVSSAMNDLGGLRTRKLLAALAPQTSGGEGEAEGQSRACKDHP